MNKSNESNQESKNRANNQFAIIERYHAIWYYQQYHDKYVYKELIKKIASDVQRPKDTVRRWIKEYEGDSEKCIYFPKIKLDYLDKKSKEQYLKIRRLNKSNKQLERRIGKVEKDLDNYKKIHPFTIEEVSKMCQKPVGSEWILKEASKRKRSSAMQLFNKNLVNSINSLVRKLNLLRIEDTWAILKVSSSTDITPEEEYLSISMYKLAEGIMSQIHDPDYLARSLIETLNNMTLVLDAMRKKTRSTTTTIP